MIEERPNVKKSSFQTREMEINDEPEDDTPLPYLGNRSPPDGTDETLDFSGDNANSGRSLGLDLDSPPSLNLSTGSANDLKTSDKFDEEDDFSAKQVIEDRSCNNCEIVLENVVDASVTTSQQSFALHDRHLDRHIEGGSDENDELEVNPDKSQLKTETQENLEVQQSLKLDIGFDDFTDFQSVPPDKCEESTSEGKWESEIGVTHDEMTFDVDFSNFQADFSETPPEIEPTMTLHGPTTEIDDAFDTFQEFCTDENQMESKNINTVIKLPETTKTVDLGVDFYEDDDDFGDFNDFQTTSIANTSAQEVQSSVTLPTLTTETFKEIIDKMFSVPASHVEEMNDETTFDAIPFEKNNITSKLKDIEMSRALSYKYTSSVSSKTLMESIGIDSKNVVSFLLSCHF